MSWLRRLSNTFRPARVQRDIDRELAFHLAERADALGAEGASSDEARRRARIEFGNPAVQAERTRDVDVALWLDGAWRTLRLAIRSLRRAPGFTATVVLTLALGIGANSAVFSAIDAVLLRPLPFPDGDRLVRVMQTRPELGETGIAPVRLEDWNRLSSTFDAISGYSTDDVVDTSGEVPERVLRSVVAPRFLDVLGVTPALGRAFLDEEHRFAGPSVVLISDRYWRKQGADPDVLDRTVRAEGASISTVGVMPASFGFPDAHVDVWSPSDVDAPWAQSRDFPGLTGIGRLRPGVTLDEARADLRLVQAQLAEQHPETDRGIGVSIVPLKETVVGATSGSLWLLFGAVCVLLLIACTNVAALLLSRAARRDHEVAVRYSLGASRAGVAAQMLTEAAVLALASAALGVVVAAGAAAAFRVMAPELPRVDEIAIDARMLLYVAAAACVVAVLCGLFPALRSAGGRGPLAESVRTQVSARHPLQWLLVGVQVALSVMLLAAAGLLLRSGEALSRVAPGFDPARVLAFHVSGRPGVETFDALVGRVNGALDALEALPGIEAAATASRLPGVPGGQPREFELEEGQAGTAPRLIAESRMVSPGYFATMGIPLLAGELCRRPPDARVGTTEVMVNRSFVDRYFQGRPVLGLHLTGPEHPIAGDSPNRIAGVVGDARELGLERDPVPTVYACFSAPDSAPWFLVRTSGEPAAAVAPVRRTMGEIEPLRSVYDAAPLASRLDEAYAQNRLRTWLLTVFALTALALVCAGVYGTLSYAVSLRTREVALRLALGALRRDVVRQLVRTTVYIASAGCIGGLVLALIVAQSLSAMLYGVSPSDPANLATVIAVVMIVAALAALVPAVRAASVQPMGALREE